MKLPFGNTTKLYLQTLNDGGEVVNTSDPITVYKKDVDATVKLVNSRSSDVPTRIVDQSGNVLDGK